MRHAEYPAPERVLLHLSDTHLRAAGSRLFDLVDATARLKRALGVIEASGVAPDGIVFTGDLVDLGEGDAYAELRAIVEPFAARLGARVFWVMGNHDDRAAFRSRLLDEHSADPMRSRGPRRRARRTAARHPGLDGPRTPSRRAARRPARVAGGRARHPGAARHDPRDAPPAGAERPPARGHRRAARPGAPGRCAARHRRARHHRGPPALLDVRHLRRHPGLGGVIDLLRAGPDGSRRRHPAAGRRAGVQPRPRVRRDRSCTRSCPVDAPRTLEFIDPAEARRRLAAAGIAAVSASPTDAPTEPIGVLR